MPLAQTSDLDVTSTPRRAERTARATDEAAQRDAELVALRRRVEELTASQRTLEEQVRHLHRAKTISDLLAGVAHDLSGALTGILWCSEALRRRVATLDADLSSGLADFVGAAEYARKLARRLISIGRQRDGSSGAVLLQDAVRDALSLLDALRPGNVQLTIELAVPDAHVWGNADELQQIVVNLVTNAFDAVSERGGSVHVSLTASEPPAGADSGTWLRLRVEDTGDGMSPTTLHHAFEPFFTTKGAHDGNGLGLVVVKALVQRHGARLTAKSSLGEGTTMDVMFPLWRQPAVR